MAARSGKGGVSGVTPPAGPAAPETVEEALSRARDHGRLAVAESLAALQSLLDAAALGLSGEAARRDAILGPLSNGLEELRKLIAPDDSLLGTSLLDALFDALDAEIERWELRSREDPNARSVLRAFLGVREILWEISARLGKPAASPQPEEPERRRPKPSGRRTGAGRRKQVRRVRVEG